MRIKKETRKLLLLPTILAIGIILGFSIAYVSGLQPSIIPITSALLGLAVAFTIPVWQALSLNAPKLSIEVNAITRSVSSAALLSIEDYPELTPLKALNRLIVSPFEEMDFDEIPSKGNSKGKTIVELETLLDRAKQQMRDLPEKVEKRRKELEGAKAIRPTDFSKYDADRLNRPIIPELEFDPSDKEATLSAFISTYSERLQQSEKQYGDLQAGLPIAERKVEQLKAELIDSRSYFTVSLSLINSGRTNTAIKVPALLRVSIGEGHYVDIKLSLKDFEEKSEISANGTRIVLFESAEVSSFPEDDRKLIKTYWGQSVSARLFLEDIHSQIYSSNAIAFAEGLYQKIIYDRLAQVAGAVKS